MSRSLTTVLTVLVMLAFAGSADARRRAISHPEPPFHVAYTEGGYADRTSVMQGAAIDLHIATSSSPFMLKIVNLADPANVRLMRMLTSAPRNCSGRAAQGCDWPVTTTVDVPESWPSGYYAATFPTTFGERSIIFVVRESDPGSYSRTVLISPTHSYQAYNDFGGKSLYPATWPERALEVSFDRPYTTGAGLGRYTSWEKHFVDWMAREGRPFEVITDSDMEDPAVLSRYDLAVLVGHSEYWTAAGRATLEEFSRNGGHLAILGGNTMWWQVRLDENGRTLVGYKHDAAKYDPALQTASNLVTTNFFAPPVNQPENRILGTSFRNGGYANRNDNPAAFELKPLAERTPYRVTNASHWVFDGTSLANGSFFGRDVAGLEVDGVVFNCDAAGNVIGPDGSDDAPLNYHILAVVPASFGWGTMGIHVSSAGGAVFNAATQGWVGGLDSNETIQRITANVLDRLGSGVRLMYDPVQTAIVAQDTFNCPRTLIASPGWRGDTGRGSVTQSCAYEGPGGLELSGAEGIALSRRIAPAGSARDHVELRFYLNADGMAQRTVHPMPVVTLQNRSGTIVRQVAMVEIDASAGSKRIRIARRDPEGIFAVNGNWIDLSPGWHLVEATWRSPGALQLQIDGGAMQTLDNPFAGQTANEMVIELAKPELTGEGLVCVDAIAAATQRLGGTPALR